MAQHLPEQAIEPKQPVLAPLDVLAQVIVAMTGVDTWDIGIQQAGIFLDQLVDDQRLIWGPLIKKDANTYYCDARNFDILLRLERRSAQPVVEPQPCEALALILARVQGLIPGYTSRQDPVERLLDISEQMCGFLLAAHLWEGEVLPARMPAYDPAWLDSLM